MRTFIDTICPDCGTKKIDAFVTLEDKSTWPLCETCGRIHDRLQVAQNAGAVIGDDIPGGVEIKHGLCNPDGTPRKYYSHSEIRKEAARRGLMNHVEHKTERGSDKSRHTSRWV